VARKLAVEAIGMFFFVLTIGLVVLQPGVGALAPLAIGSALMVMVYAGGHVSGAHYNPAVTLAVMMRGLATPVELAGYWAAQIAAAILAALAVGITTMGITAPSYLWVLLLGNLAGGAAAALVFNVLDLGSDKATTATPADQARLEPAARPGD
jgi:aquaporin Z